MSASADITFMGHMCYDEIHPFGGEPATAPGSAVLCGAMAAARVGAKVCVVTRVNTEDDHILDPMRELGVEAAMLGPWCDGPLFRTSLASSPGLRARLEAIVRDFPGADYLATARDRVERDWTVPDRLHEITCRTTVVSAALTLPGFRAWGDEIAATIPGARQVVIQGVGHLLPLECPERLAEEILAV